MSEERRQAPLHRFLRAPVAGHLAVVLLVGCGDPAPLSSSARAQRGLNASAPAAPASTLLSRAGRAEATDGILISAIGDCTLGSEHGTFARVIAEHAGDPAYPFSGVAEVLASDDLTIANLEGTLTDEPRRRDKVTFRGNPGNAAMLVAGSVELVDVANNHSHDCGGRGFEETVATLRKEEIGVFGREIVDRRVLRGIEVINLGFMGGEVDNLERVPTQVSELKRPDNLIIVSFHWGGEGIARPNKGQYVLGRATIEAGADLVLGHHPHVLQGIEDYRGGRIAFSLGNFVFGGDSNPDDTDSMIYQARFALRGGRIERIGERVVPVSISSTPGRGLNVNDYRPVVLGGVEGERVLDKIVRLSADLAPPWP